MRAATCAQPQRLAGLGVQPALSRLQVNGAALASQQQRRRRLRHAVVVVQAAATGAVPPFGGGSDGGSEDPLANAKHVMEEQVRLGWGG